MATIYIVEDDVNIREIERYALKNSGYQVEEFECGADLFKRLESKVPALILLDIMLPNEDGLDILTKIRTDKNTAKVPIIMVTAKTSELDKVKGLDLGADDYISKPFSLREVIMRVKAVLRRTANVQTREQEQLQYRDLVIDIPKKKVTISGEEISLTKKEFEILLLLLQNQGRVFSREDILAKVWHDEVYVLDRTIDVNITRLRKKIGNYGKYIVTRLGYGYCFECE